LAYLLASPAAANCSIIANPETSAEFICLATEVACELLERSAPPEILEMLRHQAELDVPLLRGSEENRFFSMTALVPFSLKSSVAVTNV
jgi:hypothetical protein